MDATNAHSQPQETNMFQEAAEAARAVERFLYSNTKTLVRIRDRLLSKPPKSVTTCARGSSDHAATYAKYMIETYLGIPTSSAALSVVSVFAAEVQGADSLCIAISQSGRSPDLLETVKKYKDAGAFVVTLVNDETSPLAKLADELLPLCAGPEHSVAATKSYIASLAAVAALVAHWTGDESLLNGLTQLSGHILEAFESAWQTPLHVLVPARNLFVIGRGYSFAIAQEAALKLKETCALHAEAFSAAEVQHGPMAIVDADFPILAFATSDEAGAGVLDVCKAFEARGAKVWLLDAKEAGACGALPAPIPPLEPIVQIAAFYRFANQLALARGLNPDAPPHLKKVTQTI